MQNSLFRKLIPLLAFALGGLTPSGWAQLTTTGISGFVRDTSGKPVPGATVSAVYAPTNARFAAETSESGRYNLRGLPVGGPYSITATAAATPSPWT